jgi:ribosomal protein S13
MQEIELDDVNHIPLAMNEFRGVGQRETKKTP